MNPIKKTAKIVDDRLFNDSFRRAAVHGKLLQETDVKGDLRRGLEAMRRERTVSQPNALFRPEFGRFIGGVSGRSGTTWITRIMSEAVGDTHAVMGEQGLFVLSMFRDAPYEYLQFGGVQAGRERYLDYLYRMLTKYAYKRRRMYGGGLKGLMRFLPKRAIDLAFPKLRQDLRECNNLAAAQVAFGDFYQSLFNYHAAVLFGHPAAWISKEPPYGRHADDLFKFVPTARLLVMARDGREAALSMFKRGWMDSVRGCMQRWAEFTSMTLDALDRSPEGQWKLVRYDDLVRDFGEQLSDVFEHLELPKPDVGKILDSGKKELIPRSDSLQSWKKTISKEDIDWFASQYGDLMERIGYRE